MTQPTFTNVRQQAGAAGLALSLTLGMLLSVNLLATQPAEDAQMAAAAAAATAASQAQLATRAQRSPQG